MSTGNNKSGDNFIKQGTILAAASVVSRIIGMLYRSPMSAAIGDEGNGLYSFAFEIYSIALILSSYSMPLAVSKLLSARFAKREYKNGMRIFWSAMFFASAAGLIMTLIIFLGAGLIEKASGYVGLATPLRVLSPTIFVVAIAGTLRGFFQSRKTMMPTAVSQLIEQIVNAIVSVAAAFLFVHLASSDVGKAKWGAAGGTLGTLFGALSALAFLIFTYVIYKPRMKRHLGHDTTGYTESGRDISKLLAATIIPIILSQTVYQSIGIIDGFIFGNIYDGADRTVLYGIYSSKYRLMVNIPNAISSALASSMIPTLVSLYALGNRREFRNKLASSVKFNMVIAFPCAIGLMVLAWPIMKLLFPTTDTVVSGNMLFFGGIAVIFYALSTVTNAALQGLDKMRIPVIHAAISLVIHVVLIYVLLLFTDLSAYALVIGNITYPLVVCILNWFSVAKYAEYRQEIRTTFIVPAIASIVMGGVVFGISKLMQLILPSGYFANALLVMVCLIIAVAVYFVVLFLLKGLTREELKDFPMGMRLARLATKLKLMR